MLLACQCLVSCKSDSENKEDVQLILSSNQVQIGDSISVILSNESQLTSVTIIPNVGQFRNGYYIAPQTLATQALTITLRTKLNDTEIAKNCTIVRGLVVDSTISFTSSIMPILVGNCNFSGCHGNGSRAGGVDLSIYDSVLKHVVLYQPTQSILYLSLVKTDPLRRMPPAGPLNNNKIVLIQNWITQGALNN